MGRRRRVPAVSEVPEEESEGLRNDGSAAAEEEAAGKRTKWHYITLFDLIRAEQLKPDEKAFKFTGPWLPYEGHTRYAHLTETGLLVAEEGDKVFETVQSWVQYIASQIKPGAQIGGKFVGMSVTYCPNGKKFVDIRRDYIASLPKETP